MNNHRHKVVSSILGDHRALAAVLHGMRHLIKQTRDRAAAPRFDVLRAMLYYIDVFPEREHHPKESRHLFVRIRARTAEADVTLDELDAEHALGNGMIRHLEQALLRYEAGGAEFFVAFATAVEAYCDFHYRHMRLEEDVVIPIAERVLTDADWEQLDVAFSGNPDPLTGIAAPEDFDRLYSRIVAIAPPPIGVGPEDPAAR